MAVFHCFLLSLPAWGKGVREKAWSIRPNPRDGVSGGGGGGPSLDPMFLEEKEKKKSHVRSRQHFE